MKIGTKGEIGTVLTIGSLIVITAFSLFSSLNLKKSQTMKTKAVEVSSCPSDDPEGNNWYCAGECADKNSVRSLFKSSYPPPLDAAAIWRAEKARNCGISVDQCFSITTCQTSSTQTSLTPSPSYPSSPTAIPETGSCKVGGKYYPLGYCSPRTNASDLWYCSHGIWKKDTTSICIVGKIRCIGRGYPPTTNYPCCSGKVVNGICDSSATTISPTLTSLPTPTEILTPTRFPPPTYYPPKRVSTPTPTPKLPAAFPTTLPRTPTPSLQPPAASGLLDCTGNVINNLIPGVSTNLLSESPRSAKFGSIRCLKPKYIVIHWSGAWNNVGATKQTLETRRLATQLATDQDNVIAMQNFFEDRVEAPHYIGGDGEYLYSINNELTGVNFDQVLDNLYDLNRNNLEKITIKALTTTCFLMKKYNIDINNVIGYFNVYPAKKDPGQKYLNFFKDRLSKGCSNGVFVDKGPQITQVIITPTSVISTTTPITQAVEITACKNKGIKPFHRQSPIFINNEICEDGSLGRGYGKDYIPPDLIDAKEALGEDYWIAKNLKVRLAMVEDLKKMLDFLRSEIERLKTEDKNRAFFRTCIPFSNIGKCDVFLASGYRSWDEQNEIWKRFNCEKVTAEGKFCGAARPGWSSHQGGAAIDTFCACLVSVSKLDKLENKSELLTSKEIDELNNLINEKKNDQIMLLWRRFPEELRRRMSDYNFYNSIHFVEPFKSGDPPHSFYIPN